MMSWDVTIEAAKAAIQTSDWLLRYALTVHSSQGLTESLYYWRLSPVVKSRISRGFESRVHASTWTNNLSPGWMAGRRWSHSQSNKSVMLYRKSSWRTRSAIGLKKGLFFDLNVVYILQLKEDQQNWCTVCNIERLWANQPKDTQQFSVDRLDNNKGHCKGNVG